MLHHRRPPGPGDHERPARPRLVGAAGARAAARRGDVIELARCDSRAGAAGATERLAQYAGAPPARSASCSRAGSPGRAVRQDRDHRDHHRARHHRCRDARGCARRPIGRERRRRSLDQAGGPRSGRDSIRQEFLAAWANGQAFLHAADGLRGRPPRLVEWKGPTQAPGRRGGARRPAGRSRVAGQLQVPVQGARQRGAQPPVRPGPRAGGPARTAGDWYAEVAADAYQALYALVRIELGTERRSRPTPAT